MLSLLSPTGSAHAPNLPMTSWMEAAMLSLNLAASSPVSSSSWVLVCHARSTQRRPPSRYSHKCDSSPHRPRPYWPDQRPCCRHVDSRRSSHLLDHHQLLAFLPRGRGVLIGESSHISSLYIHYDPAHPWAMYSSPKSFVVNHMSLLLLQYYDCCCLGAVDGS
jgi:hypothetical protein